ncbi:MAG TPA: M67 family metallopeptidase [Thermoplasmata archaeon]
MYAPDPAPVGRRTPADDLGTASTTGPGEPKSPRLEISRDARATMISAAVEARPREACGLLFGEPTDGRPPLRVHSALAVANSTLDRPEASFWIDPAVIRRDRASRTGPTDELVGFFHSHPAGSGGPSRRDVENAWPWYVHVIVEVESGSVPRFHAFTLDPFDRSVRRLDLERAPSGTGDGRWPG